ncbi:MAG: hypothetical protein R3C05_24715 [Pirellulaceae bacterium]
MQHSVIVFESSDRKSCLESQLVLESVGVPSRLLHQQATWVLAVDNAFADTAINELRDYESDRVASRRELVPAVKTYAFASAAMVIYAGIVLLFGTVTASEQSRALWVNAGGMDAGKVCDGHLWRTTTALTLHADGGHLLSNLVFGRFFGLLTEAHSRRWCRLADDCSCRSIGNGMNALIRDADHVSIMLRRRYSPRLASWSRHALRPSMLKAGTKCVATVRSSLWWSGSAGIDRLDGERTDASGLTSPALLQASLRNGRLSLT